MQPHETSFIPLEQFAGVQKWNIHEQKYFPRGKKYTAAVSDISANTECYIVLFYLLKSKAYSY